MSVPQEVRARCILRCTQSREVPRLPHMREQPSEPLVLSAPSSTWWGDGGVSCQWPRALSTGQNLQGPGSGLAAHLANAQLVPYLHLELVHSPSVQRTCHHPSSLPHGGTQSAGMG